MLQSSRWRYGKYNSGFSSQLNSNISDDEGFLNRYSPETKRWALLYFTF